jgi:hypothetical protein
MGRLNSLGRVALLGGLLVLAYVAVTWMTGS